MYDDEFDVTIDERVVSQEEWSGIYTDTFLPKLEDQDAIVGRAKTPWLEDQYTMVG